MSKEKEFTHLDQSGRAQMVDLTDKDRTKRRATASGKIFLQDWLLQKIEKQEIDKGDALATARVAAVMAVKRTSDLIPLCHPLPLRGIEVDFIFHHQEPSLEVQVTASVYGVTGVEMEVLTGASVALLTVYDMCKALDKEMELGSIFLMEKEGGKSGSFLHSRLQQDE